MSETSPEATPSPLASRGLIVGAAALWSTGGAAVKLANLDAAQIAGGRSLVLALVFLLFLPSSRGRWSGRVLLAGAFYATTSILFVFANTKTTAGNTIFLQNIAPVWVLLISPWLLQERPTRLETLSVPISLGGSLLFFAGALEAGQLVGNLAAVGASFSYALLIVSYRKLTSAEGLTATVAGSVMVVVATLPFAWGGPAPDLPSLGAVLYLGAIQQGLGGLLFIRGIRGVSALEGALLILLEPLLTPVWAFFLVGEIMSGWAIAGGGLILGAALARSLAARPSS